MSSSFQRTDIGNFRLVGVLLKVSTFGLVAIRRDDAEVEHFRKYDEPLIVIGLR